MVDWFKEKKSEDVLLEVEHFFNKHLGPILLATETAENISRYFKRIKEREISFPAYKRKDSNILQVWIDTRLELLHHLWQRFDNFNPIVLTELERQKELLACIKEAKIKYVWEGVGRVKYTLSVTSTNKELKDMLNAIIMMYQTSLNISDEICVEEVEKVIGNIPEVEPTICSFLTCDPFQEIESTMGIKDFLEDVNKASADWLYYCNKLDSHEPLPARPKTIFEIIFEDITRKSKIIALTAVAGPDYRKNFMNVIDIIKERVIKDGMSTDEAKEQAKKQQELFDYLVITHPIKGWLDGCELSQRQPIKPI